MSAKPATLGAPTADPHVAVVARPRMPRIGWAGALLVAGVAVVAVAGPLLTPYRVTELAGDPLEAPSVGHLLGTNSVGQDLISQLVAGARVSLFVALVAGGGTVLLGAAVGTVAGWSGGRIDAVLMRLVDSCS